MTTLADACADLRPLLPIARELITEPDTLGGAVRHEPASCPPWNAAAANAHLDIHAAVRDLERCMRYEVTGTITVRGGSDANTDAALDAIVSLGYAVAPETADGAARILARLTRAVLMLPAVDVEERPRRLSAICPECDRCMVSAWTRDGKVACLGCGLRGLMMPGTVSDGCIQWADGSIT